MKKNGFKGCFHLKEAFTLIELLVVVLIIGILAAVALPQYRKAVVKSRYVNAIPGVNSIVQAAEVYYLANGEYPDDTIEPLDIDGIACQRVKPDAGGQIFCKGYTFDFNAGATWKENSRVERVDAKIFDAEREVLYYLVYLLHSPQFGAERYCRVIQDEDIYHQVCKSMGGVLDERSHEAGGSWYRLP